MGKVCRSLPKLLVLCPAVALGAPTSDSHRSGILPHSCVLFRSEPGQTVSNLPVPDIQIQPGWMCFETGNHWETLNLWCTALGGVVATGGAVAENQAIRSIRTLTGNVVTFSSRH
jgi:hypothetical protein